jgi:NDP-sugar pyrophosphorylase family protein
MRDSSAILIVLLSGGKAKRFSQLGLLLPKPLLPASNQQTLLSRNLDFLQQLCGIKVVSTSPALFDYLSCFMRQYNLLNLEKNNKPTFITLAKNEQHEVGPVEAFHKIICEQSNQQRFRKFLLYLSDLFFQDNPFGEVLLCSTIWHDDLNYLWVREPLDEKEILSSSGIAEIKEGKVVRLSLSNKSCLSTPNSCKSLWSGIALLRAACRPKIQIFVNNFQGASEDELINMLINEGEIFKPIPCPHFTNVNCYQQLLEVLAWQE